MVLFSRLGGLLKPAYSGLDLSRFSGLRSVVWLILGCISAWRFGQITRRDQAGTPERNVLCGLHRPPSHERRVHQGVGNEERNTTSRSRDLHHQRPRSIDLKRTLERRDTARAEKGPEERRRIRENAADGVLATTRITPAACCRAPDVNLSAREPIRFTREVAVRTMEFKTRIRFRIRDDERILVGLLEFDPVLSRRTHLEVPGKGGFAEPVERPHVV